MVHQIKYFNVILLLWMHLVNQQFSTSIYLCFMGAVLPLFGFNSPYVSLSKCCLVTVNIIILSSPMLFTINLIYV